MRYLVISLYLLLNFFILPAEAKTVMVIIDHLSLADWQKIPQIQKLIPQSSIALMNTNTARNKEPGHSYLTIGSGQRSLAGALGGYAFNSSQIPTKLQKDKNKGKVCHLGFSEMNNLNSAVKYQAHPGLLGSTLQKNNCRTAVFGNSDFFNPIPTLNRCAASIAANEKGEVNSGDVSSAMLKFNSEFPWNYSSDFNKLKQAFLHTEADFFVLETGDISRLEKYQPFLAPDYYQQLKTDCLKEISDFLQSVTAALSPSDLLLLVSPTANREALKENNSLTPVLIQGKGFSPGLIYSPTTHKAGLITNIDLAPTILAYFAAKQTDFLTGHPLSSKPVGNSLAAITKLEKNTVATAQARLPVLKTYVISQITVLFLWISSLFFQTHLPDRFFLLLQKICLLFMLTPLLLLILPLFHIFSTAHIFAVLTILCCGLLAFIRYVKPTLLSCFTFIGLTTSAALLLDLITGQNLLGQSLLSYDPMIGARFYGIGNEYSGVLLGSAILGSSSWLEKHSAHLAVNRLIVLFFLISLTLLISAPVFGADAGGAVTCLFTFSLLSCYLWGIKIRPHIIGWIMLIILLFLSILCLIDLSNIENTHIGLAVSSIKTEGLSNIRNIIINKLNTNLRLIRYTIWSRFLLTTIAALTVLFFCPVGIIKKIFDKYTLLGKGLISISIASIVGLIVNDSGVVQAATTILYGIYPLICLVIQELTYKITKNI